MSENQPTQKKKTAKKYVVIVLTVAILFFLLLPLLDDSTTTDGTTPDKQKAIPQIFTSNPLSKLVRQVYNMLAGKKRANGRAVVVARADAGQVEMDVTRAASQQLNAEQRDSVSDGTYGHPDYILLDEDWALTQQIAPESSQRGLHEVNASDSAYDRLIRSERQAKYAGVANKQEIPQSKWARFWKPIKKFFTGEDDTEMLAAADGPNGVKVGGFGSKGSSEFGDGAARTPGWYGAAGANWNMPGAGYTGSAADPNGLLATLLINPDQALQNMSKQMKDLAGRLLNSEDRQKFEQNERDIRMRALKEAREIINQQLSQAAGNTLPRPEVAGEFLLTSLEGNEQDSILTGAGCGSGRQAQTAFHAKQSSDSCMPVDPYESNSEEVNRSHMENQQKFIQNMSQKFDIPPNVPWRDIPVLVVVGMIQPGENPFNPDQPQLGQNDIGQTQPDDKIIYDKFIDWMLEKQGCKDNPCVITAATSYPGKDLKDSLTSGAMQPVTLGPTAQELTEAFKNDFQGMPAPSRLKEAVAADNFSLDPYLPAFNVTPVKTVQEQFAHKPGEPNFTQAYTLTAATAKQLADQNILSPFQVFYGDTNESSFSVNGFEINAQEQGNMMSDQLINALNQRHEVLDNIAAKYEKETGVEITKSSAKRALKNLKENASKDLDQQMGLQPQSNSNNSAASNDTRGKNESQGR